MGADRPVRYSLLALGSSCAPTRQASKARDCGRWIAKRFSLGQYHPQIGGGPANVGRAVRVRLDERMVAAKPTLFIAATALSVALLPSATTALVQPDIENISCELFLSDIDTNPADYILYRSFIQGYLAAKISSDAPGIEPSKAEALMTSVVNYCHGRAKESFASAIAAALKK
jgi:hypothetical protein